MPIKIKQKLPFGGDDEFFVPTDDSTTIGDVKTLIEGRKEIPASLQTLLSEGNRVKDHVVLKDMRLSNRQSLRLVVEPMPGGLTPQMKRRKRHDESEKKGKKAKADKEIEETEETKEPAAPVDIPTDGTATKETVIEAVWMMTA